MLETSAYQTRRVFALETGQIFGAGLGMFTRATDINPKYRDLSNVFLSPHMGSARHEARDAMGMFPLDGIAAIKRGECPDNQPV